MTNRRTTPRPQQGSVYESTRVIGIMLLDCSMFILTSQHVNKVSINSIAVPVLTFLIRLDLRILIKDCCNVRRRAVPARLLFKGLINRGLSLRMSNTLLLWWLVVLDIVIEYCRSFVTLFNALLQIRMTYKLNPTMNEPLKSIQQFSKYSTSLQLKI